MWAVVPLKSPDAAKSRLAGVLAPEVRRALYFAMADHVLRTLRATPEIHGTLVVTGDAQVQRLARDAGTGVLHEPAEAGTASACELALGSGLVAADAPVLFVSGDLPLLSVAATQALLRLLADGPSIVVAPDRRREGTNALCCSHAGVVPLCFGPQSFARHLEEARARSVAAAIYESSDLALDIDDATDLRRLHDSEQWRGWLNQREAVAAP